MAYQINYYSDRAMRRREADSDMVGDDSVLLNRYPAPTGDEVVYARHSNDPSLNAYGYDGEWHSQPPTETIEADRRVGRMVQRRAHITNIRIATTQR